MHKKIWMRGQRGLHKSFSMKLLPLLGKGGGPDSPYPKAVTRGGGLFTIGDIKGILYLCKYLNDVIQI